MASSSNAFIFAGEGDSLFTDKVLPAITVNMLLLSAPYFRSLSQELHLLLILPMCSTLYSTPPFFFLKLSFHFESVVISGFDQEFSQPVCHFKMNPYCVCKRLAPGCHNYCHFVCKQTIRSCKGNSNFLSKVHNKAEIQI